MKKLYAFLAISGMLLVSSQAVLAQTKYRLPLASNPGYSAHFDHDGTSALLRWDCSTNFQYNNHHGVDFATSTGTTVVAGATGSLYYRLDGCPDGSNPSCGGGYGNHVRIQHSDSRVTIYAHLKNGTPAWYQSITCGGSVGQSGNSGTSTGPHLHFELWQSKSIGTRIDFYGGSCNSPSYWVNQNGGFPTTQCQ